MVLASAKLFFVFSTLFACTAWGLSLNAVAGIGRFFGAASPEAVFELAEVTDAVAGIIGSLDKGNNRTSSHVLPVKKVYGTNMGNWLLFEPWIAPSVWEAMGGQICSSCSACRMSEWSLATYLGQAQTNSAFQAHWNSWFTQADVDEIVAAGLNTLRIPLGFWIIEDLVDRPSEPYAQGGLDELIRGLTMLKKAGINVLLDHHALPGVSSANQMFAGNCTSQVEFYSSPDNYNYKRAVTWSVVVTWLIHVHPEFSTVFGLEAINEPTQNYADTPGLDQFEKSFVLAVRAIELSLGIICDISFVLDAITDDITLTALRDALPIITKLAAKYGLAKSTFGGLSTLVGAIGGKGLKGLDVGGLIGAGGKHGGRCIATTFMNRDWQYSTTSTPVPNPATYARGPQLYDNHLYFNFGGVAAQTEEAYMQVMCNLTRVQDAADIGDAPMIFGEWAISTNSSSTSNTFLKIWGDAQKLAYSQGAGWLFWNWKVDSDAQVPRQIMWSYKDALVAGVFTAKPDEYFDVNVCANYFANLNSTTSS